MAWKWKPWGARVRDSQTRTHRVETKVNLAEFDLAKTVARSTLMKDRVERAAVQVLQDHEAVAAIAASARRGGTA
jgi:hypothetical protein